MRILFLCGSLKAGYNGVGDYTRRLAGEIIKQGHNASIIALNDRHINAIEQTEQESDGMKISVLRLPSVLSTKKKYNEIENFIIDFDPEWLSLQFVPYSFQKRGLPFSLGKRLERIGRGRKWHVMFHELGGWQYKNIPLKDICIGILQQLMVKDLIRKIKPKAVHTNIKWRICRLQSWNIQSKLLPLFGNIPVKFEKSENNSSSIIFIVFGNIHFGADIAGFAEWLSCLQQAENKKVIVCFAGNNGSELILWKECLNKQGIEYEVYGIQDKLIISKLLSQADIGIITTPYSLIEKSGSLAAMQEHQLPIICVARKRIPKNILFTHDVAEWKPNLHLTDVLKQKIKAHYLHEVTKQFINDIY